MTMFFSVPSFTKAKSVKALCLLTALWMLPITAWATSEVTPNSWELSLPASAQTTTVIVEENEAENIAEPANSNTQTNTQNTGRAAQSSDPCPTPRAAKTERLDDLARVQEDIDRFALCVQRAQLLERLNDSAERATETLDNSLGYGGLASSAALPRGGAMPPLPAGALGGFDVSPAAQTAPASAATPPPTSHSTADNTTQTAQNNAPAWVIREIFGPVNDMQARLLSPMGSEVLVRQGTKLEDDGGVVTTISPSGVTVRSQGKVNTLQWSGN